MERRNVGNIKCFNVGETTHKVERTWPCGCVDDFINLMYFLTNGEMDIISIPVRTLLETAYFYSLNDTQSMTYLPVTIEFWHVVLKCLGGPAL